MERKYPSMELAANRMEERRHHPNPELCRDMVDVQFEEEVRSVSLCLHQLRNQKMESKDMLWKLEQSRLEFQKEVEVKNSIYIEPEHHLHTSTKVTPIPPPKLLKVRNSF